MAVYVTLSGADWNTELMADRILSPWLKKGGQFCSERNLSRRGKNMVPIPVDYLVQMEAAPSQSFREELRFLISVTRQAPKVTSCLLLWVDGYTQSEIALRLLVTQQCVSARLRQGLIKCYDSSPITFRAFSRHTIYRRPTRGRYKFPQRWCLYCREPFPSPSGFGRYCGEKCSCSASRDRGFTKPQ